MHSGDISDQLHLLQQEIILVGEAVQTLRRDHRAEIDALRLEVEVLHRCLQLMHPELSGRLSAVRTEVLHQTDPEVS